MAPTLKPAITFVEKKDLDPAKLVHLFQQAPWAKDGPLRTHVRCCATPCGRDDLGR